MESKPKKRQVRKARSAIQEPKPLDPPHQDKTTSVEALIKINAELVEQLLSSRVWVEIVKPLLDESIASVSGRFTNGRYWHGGLTTKWNENNSIFYAAYQKALMDFYNNIHDFVLAKDKLISKKKMEAMEEKEAKSPIYNPFMEESDE